MRLKVTEKVKQELKTILDNTGYWSNDTREYIEKFNQQTRDKLHILSKMYIKGEIQL